MATVQGMTLARALALEAATIVDGYVNGSGHLILVQHDGTEIDAGSILVAFPNLDSLVDVTITSIATSHILQWDASVNQWVNKPKVFMTVAAGSDVFGVVQSGDTLSRWKVQADGKTTWGNGTVHDTNLYRLAADTLATDDNFQLTDNTKQIKVGTTPSSASFAVQRANPTDNAFSALAGSDTASRWFVQADGRQTWGDGTNLDTNLYRSVADTLKTDDSLIVAGNLTVSGSLLGAGKAFNRQIFTANGNWTKPAGAKWVRVVAIGGGGGGGGSQATSSGEHATGAGGQAGGYSESYLDASTLSSSPIAVVIGTGGAGATAGPNFGGNAGASTFGGTTVTAPGGNGGSGGGNSAATFASPGGWAGTPGTGQIATVGAPGGYGFGGGSLGVGGYGASTMFGSGGRGGHQNTSPGSLPGSAGTGYGAGGGGGLSVSASAAAAGGAGAPGIVIIDTYF